MKPKTTFFAITLVLFGIPNLFAQNQEDISLSLRESIEQAIDENVYAVKA